MGQVSHSIHIEASPEQIWTILTDVTRLPDWSYPEGRFPHAVEAKYGTDQTEGEGTIWVGIAADGQIATQKIITWEPPTRLAYELQEMEHAPLQMSQTNTFTLEAHNDHTTVTWQVDWSLTGGFSLNRWLLRFSGNRAFEEMMAGSLENLKSLVEQELPSTPEAPPEADQPPPADSLESEAD